MKKHRHITRLTRQHHKQDAYLVRVTKHGRKFKRYFHLRDYTSEQAALEAALAYRSTAYATLGIVPETEKRLAALTDAAASLPSAARAALAQNIISTLA